LLIYTNQPILEIAVAVGFASTSHLGQWFKRIYGMRPSELRERAGRRQAGQDPVGQGGVASLSPAVAFETDTERK